MGIHVALLRGINVGGKHILPMRELVRFFAAAGCRDVATYIQSGNVVFEASATIAKAVPARVAEAVEGEFGFSSPVILRSATALRKILREHPLGDPNVEPKLLPVGFLDRRPRPAQVQSLEPARFIPDRFEVRGSEIYLYYPNGIARSKLTNAYFDRVLGAVSTVRNWNTATKLLELCDAR